MSHGTALMLLVVGVLDSHSVALEDMPTYAAVPRFALRDWPSDAVVACCLVGKHLQHAPFAVVAAHAQQDPVQAVHVRAVPALSRVSKKNVTCIVKVDRCSGHSYRLRPQLLLLIRAAADAFASI
jgi:hypothetical protein